MGGFPCGKPCAGEARRELGIGPPGWVRVGIGLKRAVEGPVEGKREGKWQELPCGAGRPCKQSDEGGAAVEKGSKFGHVADALGKRDGG